jgi:hypothetical protein
MSASLSQALIALIRGLLEGFLLRVAFRKPSMRDDPCDTLTRSQQCASGIGYGVAQRQTVPVAGSSGPLGSDPESTIILNIAFAFAFAL